MNRSILSLPLLTLLAGCTAGEPAAPVDKAGTPPPERSTAGEPGSISQAVHFTYWRKIPGTNRHEPYTTDRPLSKEEQEKLGVLPPSHEIAK